METIWFVIIAGMLCVYVVLDGFDIGAGILHLLVARNDEERRTVLASIEPIWDGNEVWLIGSAGTLLFAFPRAYSAGFSGFYMPLIMALWLIILRGLSIPFRSHQSSPLWRSFWDGAFAFSSVLMAIVLGAALGNVVRGVPLDATGFFAGPLFTNFLPSRHPGVLDWSTVLVALFTLCVLAGHGALYLLWKTVGPVHERSRAVAARTWVVVVVLGILTTTATALVQPQLYASLVARPWTWLLLALIIGSLALLAIHLRRGRELPAFLASAGFIVSLLAATAAGLYPNLLISTLNEEFNLTIRSAAAGSLSLRIGLYWWGLAMALGIGYFTYLLRSFRGKVQAGQDGHGC